MQTDSSVSREVVDTTDQLAELLAATHLESTIVPGLSWNVGELGAHLASLPDRYQRMMAAREPFPDSLAAMNEAEIEAISVRNPADLASRLKGGVRELVGLFGNDGTRPIPFFGMDQTVDGVAGVLLGELLLHGLDLAKVTGAAWTIHPGQARMVLRGLLPAAVHSVDADVVSRLNATFHILIRPDDHWTLRVREGTAAITMGKPARADLHLSADPVAYLLVGYGRASRIGAALTGKILAYGRKPWLLGPLSKLFAES